MNSAEMAKEIRARSATMRDAESGAGITVGELADDSELLLVLARIVEGKSVDRAFGSPGDWGYNHPIGRALAAKEEAVQS